MKITVYVVSTCIPERGEKPCQPSVFSTEVEAEAYAEECLKAEWESSAMDDEETGEPIPYPGNWRDANDKIAANYSDGSWGEWQLTGHEIEIGLPAPATDALRTASGAICSLQEQIDQMSGMFSDSDGAIAQAMTDGDEAVEAIKAMLA